MISKIEKDLQKAAKHEKIEIYQRFFKTGKGEYGEGDVFLGITVPDQRSIAKKYVDASFKDIKGLLYSKYHEHRLTGLLILVYKYEKSDEKEKKKVVDYYLKHKSQGNNWDLIDCIADKLLGNYLLDKDKSLLYKLAKSESLWDRRISIITTFAFIKNNQFEDTLKISELLLNDKHDLIHKATGWMLREVGKRNQQVEEEFLKKHYKKMPRTMLRYAIERFNEVKKEFYLNT